MNCDQHIYSKYQKVCLTDGCKSRLICENCEHNLSHLIIPFAELKYKFTDLNPNWVDVKIKHILEFLLQNQQKEINTLEIDQQCQYIFDCFLQEFTQKLREVQNYISNKLQLLSKQGLKNIEYLKTKINQTYNLQDIGLAIQKFEEQIYSKESLEQILKDYSLKIYGNTEIENIYNYITQNGVNHNYLDLIQIELQEFHSFKTKILSYFAKVEDFDVLLPSKYSELPKKTHAIFSWNIVQSKIDSNYNINKIPISLTVDSLYQFQSKVICVINQQRIYQYKNNLKFQQILHSCKQNDFYLTTYINQYLQLLTTWNNPTQIEMYSNSKKIRIILNASLNPINQIIFIHKYNIYSVGKETCILTLDSNGIIKINNLSHNYLYDFTYGQGIQEVQILPESKNALKQCISSSQDALMDLVVCQYYKNQVKLAIRSLFCPLPLSTIQDDSGLESKLGLVEHCKVYFSIFQLSNYEKQYIKKQMNIEGIDYVICTLFNNTISLWNWKTGNAFRIIDAEESHGIRTMTDVINGGLQTLILLTGLDGSIQSINWIKNIIHSCKLKISQGYQIHQISKCLKKIGSSQFIVILRNIRCQYMTISQLIYY